MSSDRLLPSTWYSEIGLRNSNIDRGPCWSIRGLKFTGSNLWCRLRELGCGLGAMAKSYPRKTLIAVKLAFSLTIVSLLIMTKTPFEAISSHAVWGLLTVIIFFKFSVGETLHRGVIRGAAAIFAGVLALCMSTLSTMAGEWVKVAISIHIFIAGFCTTYLRLYHSVNYYQTYGFGTAFLLVYCSVMVSSYKTGKLTGETFEVLEVIALSSCICLVIDACIFPSWAGDQLHNLLVKNIRSIADSLEGCVEGYLNHDGYERIPTEILTYQAYDKDSLYAGYRSVLESSVQESALVGNLIWEPAIIRCRKQRYPWRSYVIVSGAVRHCALAIAALHGCALSDMQASSRMKQMFSLELRRVAKEGSKVLGELGDKMERMEKLDAIDMLDDVHMAAEALHIMVNEKSQLFIQQSKEPQDIFDTREDNSDLSSLTTFVFLLVEFVARLGFIVDSFQELSEEANFQEPGGLQVQEEHQSGVLGRLRRCMCF